MNILLIWCRKRGKVIRAYPMFNFLEILDANHIAQPGSEVLERVVDCLSLHGKGTKTQMLVPIVDNMFSSLFVYRTVQPCDGSDGITLLVCRQSGCSWGSVVEY